MPRTVIERTLTLPAPPSGLVALLSTWVARLVGGLALVGMLVIGAEIAIDATAVRSPLVPATRGNGYPAWLRGPLHHGALGADPLGLKRFWLMMLVLIALYAVVVVCARQLPLPWLLGGVGGLMALMALAPPLLSADVFGYIDFARMGALHGLSPYTHAPATVLTDPVHPYVGWHSGTTPYGPLFTIASYATALVGVPAALWAFKAVALAGALAIVGLVWACARRLERPPGPAIALVGLNPLLLVYGLGGAHNDLLVMAVAMLGVFLVLRGSERSAGVPLVAAAAIKASSAVIAPFALLASGRRRGMLGAMALTCAGLALLTVLVLGLHGFGFLSNVGHTQKLVATTSVPRQVANLWDATALPGWLRVVALAGAVATTVAMLYRTARGADWIAGAGWSTFAVLVGSAWLLAWYVVWLLPLTALTRSRALWMVTIGLTVYIALVKAVPLLSG